MSAELLIIGFLILAVLVTAFVYARKADRLQKELDAEKKISAGLAGEKAGLVAELDAWKRYDQMLKEEHDKAMMQAKEQRERELKAMSDQFALLSSRNSDDFKQKSEKSISEILKPVEEKFKEFSEAVKASQKDTVERHSRLEQKIQDLDSRSKSIGDEARNLANALLGYSKIQGDFGEMILTDILANAGLKEGEHFRTQSVITDEEGREIKSGDGHRMIPDVTVFYPDRTMVVIDSKVSLNAYCEFMNADNAEDRKRAAKEHIDSVRKHINELKDKDYNGYIPEGCRRVDYTIMFIPMEGAFRLMLEEEPLLWQEAKDNGILVVSQMTLIIVLNMIQMSWKQHLQEKNIAQVYETAGSLMSQIRGWLEEFIKVGEKLQAAQDAYNDSRTRLSGGQGALKKGDSLLDKISRLEELGLKPSPSKAKIKAKSISAPGTVIPKELQR